jgi:hypothetical protein
LGKSPSHHQQEADPSEQERKRSWLGRGNGRETHASGIGHIGACGTGSKTPAKGEASASRCRKIRNETASEKSRLHLSAIPPIFDWDIGL